MKTLIHFWTEKMDIYEVTAALLFTLWGLSEITLSYKRRIKRRKKDMTDWTVFVQTMAIILSVGFGVSFEILFQEECCGIFSIGNNAFMLICSASLLIIGTIIRWSAIFQLKQWFTTTIGIQENHEIKLDGLYKTIRHPSYLGAMISFLGLALNFHSLIPVVIVFSVNITALLIRINFEEKILINHFGSEYLSYKARTKKMIPGIL